jgi:hypothetical protein
LGDRLALHPIALSGFGTKSPLATEAAISLLHRSENDDVAIIRNENSVELNLIFNANAGDPTANVLMDIPEKYPGYTHMALRVASIPATIAALKANDTAITQGPVSFASGGADGKQQGAEFVLAVCKGSTWAASMFRKVFAHVMVGLKFSGEGCQCPFPKTISAPTLLWGPTFLLMAPLFGFGRRMPAPSTLTAYSLA